MQETIHGGHGGQFRARSQVGGGAEDQLLSNFSSKYLVHFALTTMPPRSCAFCDKARAIIRRPKTGEHVCKDCFFSVFETEVHNTILSNELFKPGDKVAIGASGGKGTRVLLPASLHNFKLNLSRLFRRLDSTVLAHVMKSLNEQYNYGLDLFLLSIDEGITGYRDDSLEVRACPRSPH